MPEILVFTVTWVGVRFSYELGSENVPCIDAYEMEGFS
jgi:hypothetical protein